MYKIHFNPLLGKWQIRFLKFGFLWISVKNAEFDTLIDAQNYVGTKGIDLQYTELEPRRNKELVPFTGYVYE